MKSWNKRLLWMPLLVPLAMGALTAAAADFKDRSIKLSYVVPKDHPFGVGVNRFAELVAERTAGKTRIRGYADGQLGAELQSISAAKGGVIEMAVVSTAAAASTVKEFGLFDLPFLFNDEKEADAILDGPVGNKVLEKLPGQGLVGLCYWENGFRHATNSKHPIARAEDFRGLKIRTIQNPVFIDVFNTLGANATPMAFTEVYSALDARAIDGQETPYNSIYTSKFFEVQKYLSATKHIYGPGVVLVGKKFWDQLSADEKKVLQDACGEARDYERNVSREANASLIAELKQKGMVLNDIAPDEQAKMREKVKPVIEKYSKQIGEDLVKQAYAEIAKVRKQK